VVVGKGFAGQASAIEADRAGASVLMLDKTPEEFTGGNSRVCGQGAIAPPPHIWDAYFTYLKALTDGLGMPVDPDPVQADAILRFYIEEAHKSIAWFEGLGATVMYASELGSPMMTPGNWIPFYPHFPGAEVIAQEEQWISVGGDYAAEHTHGRNWYFLEDVIKERPGIRSMYKTPVKRLVQDPVTREVVGVVAETGGEEVLRDDGGWDVLGGKEIYVKAKRAVCICGGGWEFNQQMVRDFQHIPVVYSYGTPYNTGETIKMCWAAGADIRNMGVITAPGGLSSCGIWPQFKGAIAVSQTPSGGATITVGANNRRWRDEFRGSHKGISYREVAGLEGAYTDQLTTVENGVYVRDKYPMPIHIIFDEEARLSGSLFAGYGKGMGWVGAIEDYTPSPDNSQELEWGWITQANSIKELATKLGREPDPLFGRVPLEDTIRYWNESCELGVDRQFEHDDPLHVPYRRSKERLLPIPVEGAPVYAVEAFPRCLNTQGGMRRNTRAQVLDIEGKPIPRLYSAGENGDIWTVTYQCMSNVGGGCYGFGRVAGQNAAAEKPWA